MIAEFIVAMSMGNPTLPERNDRDAYEGHRDVMTNELMYSKTPSRIRKSRYERRHPNLSRGELNNLINMSKKR